MNTSTSFITSQQTQKVTASTYTTAQDRIANIRPLITPREREVLYLIAHEHSTKEIASKLFIGTETVNSHRKNIMIKLGVKNAAGMVRVACRRQLINT